MMNVCAQCGIYRVDKIIDPQGPYAICPECGHPHRFLQLPILFVCGASGTGKTTVYLQLVSKIPDVVLLEADILWRPVFNRPEDKYRDFFETWLRLGKNIGQSGRPVVLFSAGSIPENIESCAERRYFSETNYLALLSDHASIRTRLKERPAWRQSGDEAFIGAQLAFNDWLRGQAAVEPPGIENLDTSVQTIEQTVESVAGWIRRKLSIEPRSAGSAESAG